MRKKTREEAEAYKMNRELYEAAADIQGGNSELLKATYEAAKELIASRLGKEKNREEDNSRLDIPRFVQRRLRAS